MWKRLKDKLIYYGIILLVLAALLGLTIISSNQQRRSSKEDGGFEMKMYMDTYNEKGYIPDNRRKEE